MTVNLMAELVACAYERRIPITATMELTEACNFRCVHCYVSRDYDPRQLSLEQALRFIHEVKELGCLFLTITGGDPLLHPCFPEIYKAAVKTGMAVSVFTNGSALTFEHMTLFQEYRPRQIEITLYGDDDDRYYAVTGVRACNRIKNILLELQKKNIRVLVKYFAVQENLSDVDKFVAFCKEHGFAWKCDSLIISPQKSEQYSHQIDLESMRRIQDLQGVSSEPVDSQSWQKMRNRRGLFVCSAGRTSLWLRADGNVALCNFYRKADIPFAGKPLREIWDLYGRLEELDQAQPEICRDCDFYEVCRYCPARNEVIYGAAVPESRNQIFCALAGWNDAERRGCACYCTDMM